MPVYRKKPVEIEATRYAMEDGPVPSWWGEAVSSGQVETYHDHCEIKTLEGVMRGNVGDYIIRGVKGEIYPCKPDIFEATYEAAGDTESAGLGLGLAVASTDDLLQELQNRTLAMVHAAIFCGSDDNAATMIWTHGNHHTQIGLADDLLNRTRQKLAEARGPYTGE